MRINRLSFQNINSLRGEFTLDFDLPPLSESGIFAITGPTGAGKTTILDAICIALYGETPRLKSGSSGELITRNTGESYAEVTFTVAAGVFRSRWARRRARGAGHGKLQPPAMELAAISGDRQEIIEDQVRPVIDRVGKLTGLDFQRFSRSVMLAQGGFASFLKAKENERAELLEKMTGTRIYSLISIEAFRKAQAERQELLNLRARSEDPELLSEQELLEVTHTLATCEQVIAALRERREALSKEYETIRSHEQVEKSIAAFQTEIAACQTAKLEAGEDLEKLRQAEAVLPFRSDMRHIEELRSELQVQQTALTSNLTRQTELSEQIAALTLVKEKACQQFDSFIIQSDLREQELAAADRLDDLLHTVRQDAAAHHTVKKRLIQDHQEKHAANQKRVTELETLTKELNKLERYLKTTTDAKLGHDLSAITELIQKLTAHRTSMAESEKKFSSLQETIEQITTQKDLCAKSHEQAQQNADACQSTFARFTKDLHTLLGRSSESDFDKEWRELQTTLKKYTFLADCTAACTDTGQHRENAAQRLQQTENDLASQRQMHQAIATEKATEQRILHELEEKQQLHLLAAKYQEDRQRLAVDQPCPLCGSLHHPWQQDAPHAERTKEALTSQRKKVASLVEQFGTIGGRIQALENLCTEHRENIAQCTKKLVQKQDELMAAARELGFDSPPDLPVITATIAAKQENAESLTEKMEQIRQARARITDALQKQGTAQQELNTAAGKLKQLETSLETAKNEQNSLLAAQEPNSAILAELSTATASLLAPYGIDLPNHGQEQETLKHLRHAWERYSDTLPQASKLEKQISLLTAAGAALENDLTHLHNNIEQTQLLLDSADQRIAELHRERFTLAGESNTTELRAAMKSDRLKFETERRSSEEALQRARADLTSLEERELPQKRESIRSLEKRLQTKTAELTESLSALNFEMAKIHLLLLPEAELQALRNLKRDLDERCMRAEGGLSDARKKLTALSPRPKIAAEEVERVLAEVMEQYEEKQRTLGGLQEKLHRQQRKEKEQQEKRERIELRQKEYEKWQFLSDLIGSADGKKFRRFAQGLTLDHLIILANKHLRQLNDRYLLKRREDEDLSIEVIDIYQADSTRPTDTLSGGEEFLVSLSLALGLAHLSGNTSIDSLFLDEGFGTLDTVTLETALAALSTLHETGKTIGIISHVDALKERIPVQIQVQKHGGGISSLSVIPH